MHLISEFTQADVDRTRPADHNGMGTAVFGESSAAVIGQQHATLCSRKPEASMMGGGELFDPGSGSDYKGPKSSPA